MDIPESPEVENHSFIYGEEDANKLARALVFTVVGIVVIKMGTTLLIRAITHKE